MIILEWLDGWHAWWTAFWWSNPGLFVIMATLSVAFAVWTHGRKP